jgi:hypothetical protein
MNRGKVEQSNNYKGLGKIGDSSLAFIKFEKPANIFLEIALLLSRSFVQTSLSCHYVKLKKMERKTEILLSYSQRAITGRKRFCSEERIFRGQRMHHQKTR